MKLMRTPKKVDIDITNRCNLPLPVLLPLGGRAGDADGDGDLPAEEWLRFFGELNRCAVTEVTLAGGTLPRGDLREIIPGVTWRTGCDSRS